MKTEKNENEALNKTDVITRFKFDDLSFSGLVSKIDGDELEAKNYIIQCYYEIEKQKKIVEKMTKQLNNEESHLRSLENSIDLVFKHLSWNKPMAFILNKSTFKEIIVVSDSAVTLEKNVL